MPRSPTPLEAGTLERPDRLLELRPAGLVELLPLTGAETVIENGAGDCVPQLPLHAAAEIPRT